MATALSKMTKDHSEWVRVTPMFVTGFTKGVEFWEASKGVGYHAFQFSPAMLMEYTQGIRTYEKQGPRKDIGLLGPAYSFSFFIIAGADTGYKTIDDIEAALLRGEKIAMGEPGSTSYIAGRAWIEDGLGIPLGEYNAIHGRLVDVITWYKEGTASMATWADASAAAAKVPYPLLEDGVSARKSNFIDLPQERVDKMIEAMGADMYRLITRPAGLFTGQTKDVAWPGNTTLTAMPLGPHPGPPVQVHYDEVAYELLRVWWTYWDEGVEMSVKASMWNPEETKGLLKDEFVLPWHPGALKFYKDAGWI